jgi:hypothetical protein
MRAILNKITTDSEGASKIVFDIPSSELADVMIIHQFFSQELLIDIKPAPKADAPVAPIPQGEPEPIL